MKDRDAGHVLRVLEERQKSGSLSRQDLLLLLLTPLMDGELSQKDWITKSFLLLRGERGHMDREELARMEAVLYTLAMKSEKRATGTVEGEDEYDDIGRNDYAGRD